MKITKSSQTKDIRMSIIIYGLTGSGKTHFCGTAQDCEQTSPTLIIDIGGGMTTLINKNIDIVRPTSLTELQEVYDFLRSENEKYRSVCVDGLTGTQRELSMPEIQGTDMADPYGDFPGAMPPDRRHWLQSHAHMRLILRAFSDLCEMRPKSRRIHVILTALEKKDEDRNIVCPQLPGVVGVECGADVDILARLSIQTRTIKEENVVMRHLRTFEMKDDEGMKMLAKNRGNKLGTHMWQPTVGKIIKKWYGERE